MKKFVLDLKTWRCGADGDNMYGEGTTSLLNSQGNMCCLGQFSKQLDNKCNILNKGTPVDAKYSIKLEDNPLLKNEEGNSWNPSGEKDSKLSNECVEINDDENCSFTDKIKSLKDTLKSHGFQLEVKNDKLFNVAGQLIGKHLIAKQCDDMLDQFVNGEISVKDFEKKNTYNRQLIREYGVEKAKKFIKKLLGV